MALGKVKKPFLFEEDLFKAVKKNKLSSIQYSVQVYGKDVNIINSDGISLLAYAIKEKKNDIVEYLKYKGALEKISRLSVAILGDQKVGKTALTNQIADGIFTKEYISSEVVTYKTQKYILQDRIKILDLYELSPKPMFNNIVQQYIKSLDITAVVFDLTNSESFANCNKWVKMIKDNSPGKKIILVGTHSDCDSKERMVQIEDIEAFTGEDIINGYTEISTVSKQGTDEFVQQLLAMF